MCLENNDDVVFAHFISENFGNPRQVSKVVAVVFRKHIG